MSLTEAKPTPELGALPLAGKTALVTGASSGIGNVTAQALAARGVRVAVTARREPELGALVEELGEGAFAIPTDITDPEQVAAMVERADRELDGIDIVVNSAGLAIALPLDETDHTVWRQVIDSNLSGSFYVAREAGLRMVEGRGGTIVNIGSEMSMQGMETLTAYCAAKHGLIGLTKALACELAPKVRVNVVCPGPTETAMMRGYFEAADDPQAVREMTVGRIRLDRIAAAEEQTAAVLYLATAPQATGAVLNLDGGSTL
jgi:NAD(P)-dependent dehydrogenase (short-subunit alcohol dehydrogenase family)